MDMSEFFPEEAKTFTDKTLNDMESIIRSNHKIIGIGEIGLDYYWDKSFIELQKEIFIKQIEFANQMNLPLNIHCRDAHFDTLDILKNTIKIQQQYCIASPAVLILQKNALKKEYILHSEVL